MAKKKKGASKGLSPKIYSGLNKKRMEKKGSGGNRVILKQGDTATVQFLTGIDGFREYDIHQFQDGGRWQYVPCAGDDCPLCADDDSAVAKTTYRFCSNVYSFKEKKVLILEGPKDLAGRIAFRWEKRTKKGKYPKKFLQKTWDVSKFPTTPVSYDVEAGDDDPVDTSRMKPHDLDEYIKGEMVRYFGSEMPASTGRTALDDDDDDDDDEDEDDDEYTRDDLEDMTPKQVRKIAKGMGIATTKGGENRTTRTLIKLILSRQ